MPLKWGLWCIVLVTIFVYMTLGIVLSSTTLCIFIMQDTPGDGTFPGIALKVMIIYM